MRQFQRRPLAMFLGTVFRFAGKPLFARDVRKTLRNLEAEEGRA